MKVGISFIVPFYNASNRISETVLSLLNLSISDQLEIQLLFVDNNSDDDSVSIIKNLLHTNQRSHISATIVKEHESGRIHALKKGILQSVHEIICHVDDDNRLMPDFAINLSNYYTDNAEIDACGAMGFPNTDVGVEFPAWFEENMYSYAVGDPIGASRTLNPEKDWVYGACFSYRKKVFYAIEDSGFSFILKGRSGNLLLSGEDMEFLLAIFYLNFSVGFNQELQFQHYIPRERLTISYLRKITYGFGLASPFIGLYRAGLVNNSTHKLLRSNIFIYIVVQCFSFIFELLKFRSTLNSQLKMDALKGSITSSFYHFKKWRSCQNNRQILKLYAKRQF